MTTPPIFELRVAITVADFERLLDFYSRGLGIEPSEIWTDQGGHGVLLHMGHATLEIFDEKHAAGVDQIEVGQRVSGPVRFALRVPDVDAAVARLVAHGATLVHDPVVTPWGDRNARVQAPDGMQITLFEVAEKT